MFHVEQSQDFELIERLLLHPDIKPNLIHGLYNKEKLKNEDVLYYVFYYGGKEVGICVILVIDTAYFIDIGFISEIRGKIAIKLGRIAQELFFSHYPTAEVFAIISKKNRPSLIYAKWLGFQLCSMNEDNFLLEVTKDGWSR